MEASITFKPSAGEKTTFKIIQHPKPDNPHGNEQIQYDKLPSLPRSVGPSNWLISLHAQGNSHPMKSFPHALPELRHGETTRCYYWEGTEILPWNKWEWAPDNEYLGGKVRDCHLNMKT